jgi:hypothetical protein
VVSRRGSVVLCNLFNDAFFSQNLDYTASNDMVISA